MSLTDQIMELMLREGDINADRQREIIAAEEEKRQAKHRLLRNTLKAIATIGPYFIPGAGIVPALSRGAKVASRIAPLAGTVPAGLGYSSFAGPMTHAELLNPSLAARQTVPFGYIPPWDEEGIG